MLYLIFCHFFVYLSYMGITFQLCIQNYSKIFCITDRFKLFSMYGIV